eukprot:75733_1
MTKIGFIGLGAMGSRIAKRLSTQQTAFQLYLHDTNKHAVNSLLEETGTNKNVFGAYSLQEAISNSMYMISCLPSSLNVLDTVKECFSDSKRNPFAESGCVWMDCTSGDAKTSQMISNAYFANDKDKLYFMDTPVSGGVAKAEQGTVTCMVGCDNEWIFNKCKNDILQHISTNPTRLGDVGAGHALKCVNNLLNVSNLLILSEGLKCVEQYGMDIETALSVINASSGRSLMSQERFPKHVIQENCFYDFKLSLMKKDVQNAVNLMDKIAKDSKETEQQFVIANKVNQLLDIAIEQFGEDADYTEVTRLYVDKRQPK